VIRFQATFLYVRLLAIYMKDAARYAPAKYVVLLSVMFLAGAVQGQSDPVTPSVLTPTPTPAPEDARLSVCSAPGLEGFTPYIVRPGDRLADLLVGISNISVTQLAALNCIDDPAALPVGAVIWLPQQPDVGEMTATQETTDANSLQIVDLSASAESVPNQAGVMFSWEAVGDEAYFYTCPAASEIDCPRPLDVTPVPLIHTTPTISGFQYAGPLRYRLEVTGAGRTITKDVLIDVTCSQESLGAFSGFQACSPSPPMAIFAAWQPFQGGVMIWFSDTRQIWVMANVDQRVQVFDDLYREGEPSPDAAAPEGLVTPTRGFGKIWEQLGGAESALGWALASESGFDSARQPASLRSYTTYVQGPGVTVYAVTIIPQLEVGLWAQIQG
jgi:hypothetical protein